MTNAAKPLALLLAATLAVVICLLAMYRHAKESAATAKNEAAEMATRLESLENELAAIKESINQRQDADFAVRLLNTRATPAGLSEMMQRVAQLESQQSNILLFLQHSDNAAISAIPPEKAHVGQQAITALSMRAAAQEEKVAAAKVKLKEQMNLLNVTDNVAALDSSTALGTPSLVNYWPYFEAKQELEEALDFARLLKRKIQLEELDLGIETASQPGISQ